MFVPATWFLPLALSVLWPQLLTWNFRSTWQFCLNTWHCFSSERLLISSGIFVYCSIEWTFSKLLVSTSPIYTTRSLFPNFSCLYCYNVVIPFELEWFVKCLLFCYFTSLFCFVCCARFAAFVFVWLLHNLKQHLVKQFLSLSRNSNISNDKLLFAA